MHAEWDYEAGADIEYESSSSDEARRQYRARSAPKLNRRVTKKKTKAAPGPGLNRRRNKHWSW